MEDEDLDEQSLLSISVEGAHRLPKAWGTAEPSAEDDTQGVCLALSLCVPVRSSALKSVFSTAAIIAINNYTNCTSHIAADKCRVSTSLAEGLGQFSRAQRTIPKVSI